MMKRFSKLLACFSGATPSIPRRDPAEFNQFVIMRAQIREIDNLVEGKAYVDASTDRFLLTICVEVIYEMKDKESIRDIRPRQWFDFSKATSFTYDDISTVIRNMDIPGGVQAFLGWTPSKSLQKEVMMKLEDGQNFMLATVVALINRHIKEEKNKDRKGFTLGLQITKTIEVQPREYDILASYRRAKTIQISLENIVKFHGRFDFPRLSRDKWILKIKETLAEAGVRDLDKPVLNKLADRVNSMIEEKSSSIQCLICLEDIKFESSFKILFCKHAFHRDCIDNRLGRRPKCPTCSCPLLMEDSNLCFSDFC